MVSYPCDQCGTGGKEQHAFAKSRERSIKPHDLAISAVQLIAKLPVSITERGYVEFRADDDDGGEIVIAAILSFRSKSKLSKQEIRREIVRKACYALKRAAGAT